MTDAVEIAKPNMETVSALAPEETERLGGEITLVGQPQGGVALKIQIPRRAA